jgi:uncharacterized SAM-binding protein YcdF (DUF218 family)
MFVLLSKLLPIFVYPLGLTCVLLLLALLLQRTRWQKATPWLTGMALLGLFIASTRWTGVVLTRSLEQRYLPPNPVPSAQAIIVLGGGTEPRQAPRPSAEINGAGDRLLYAALLYQQGKAPVIYLSGGNLDWSTDRLTTPAEEMQDLLVRMGIPADDLVQQSRSRNTYEDALYTAKLLQENGIRQVLLVTSALHMPRAVPLFEAHGLQVIPAPTDYLVTEAEWQGLRHANLTAQLLNLLPSASNLNLTTNALKEYLGMWVYYLQGWMD